MYILPDAFLYKVPEGSSLRVAVMVELMAVSYNLDKTKELFTLTGEGFATGSAIVIQGVGPMGICHLIKARVIGAGTIIALDQSEFCLELAKEFGADHTLNAAQTTSDERIAFVHSLTHERGADIAEVVPEGLDMTRKGGIYLEPGNFAETREVSLSPHRHFCSKNIRLIGMTNHPFTGYTPIASYLRSLCRTNTHSRRRKRRC